ncbi:MAG: hypothetical protein P0Y59_14305 [Candidatus Sphingomonas phytovorans]|nr:hypothetical protein [Sphingomonas sp.]WEK02682.1 MAG: hypothetical protein P0Y59_14305 [Sphingomonas sp.]
MSKTTNKFAPEVRERAVRMVVDHERDYPSRWAAVVSIAEKAAPCPLDHVNRRFYAPAPNMLCSVLPASSCRARGG